MSAIKINLGDFADFPPPPRPDWGKVIRIMYDTNDNTILQNCRVVFNNQLITLEGSLEEFHKELATSTTEVERFNCIYKRLAKFKLLSYTYTPTPKDQRSCQIYTYAATELAQAQFYPNALNYLTEAVKYSSTPKELAFSMSCRSRVLAFLDLYNECIEDIDRALQLGVAPKYDVMIRKDRESAKKRRQPRELHHTTVPSVSFGKRNRHYPCARKCLNVVLNPNENTPKYYKANRLIDVGEVVIVEDPVVYTLCSARNCHCHHCLTLCYNPIPCQQCTEVVYCGEICRTRAFAQYHRIECKILKSVLKLIGNRQYLLTSFKASIIYKDEYTKTDPLSIVDDSNDEIHDCTSYEEMCKLMKHSSITNKENMITEGIIASLLYQLLKTYTTFFEGDDADAEDKFKHFLLLHIRMATKFAVTITETLPDLNMIPQPDTYGFGIYTFGVFIGHSCKPNLSVHQYGLKKVYRAVRPINPGDIFTISHWYNYYERSRDERSATLAPFGLTCHCQACKENWPLLSTDVKEHLYLELIPKIEAFTDVAIDKARRLLNCLYEYMKVHCENEPNDDVAYYLSLMTVCHNLLANRRRIP